MLCRISFFLCRPKKSCDSTKPDLKDTQFLTAPHCLYFQFNSRSPVPDPTCVFFGPMVRCRGTWDNEPRKAQLQGDYRRIYLIGKRHSHGWGCRAHAHTPACTLASRICLETTAMMDVPMARLQPGSWVIKAPDPRF